MVDSKKKVRGAGRVAFLAHLEGIKKMIDAGHPLVSVFEEYESKLSIKSGQFGKYVRKYVKGEMSNEPKGGKPADKPKEKSTKQKEKFTFDANAGNKRDDLV
jgi:hypothetical protein